MKPKMMTRWSLALLPAIGAALLIGCGESGSERGTRFLSIGTAPTGGAFYVVGGAIADVLQQNSEAGWNVTAEATSGSQENIRRLVQQELELALSNAAITYFAVRGEGDWDSEQRVQSVMTLAPNVAFFIAPEGSGVKTIGDLKGRRVVVGPAGAGFRYFIEPIVEAHGVTYDDFTQLHATQSDAVDLLADGSAAAAFLGGAVPTASITQACASQNIHFVPFDDEAKEELLANYPFFKPATIPAGTYPDQEEDYHGLNVGSMHLITAADQEEELLHQITRTLYENREGVTERHPAGNFINATNAVLDTGTPFHPGAKRYYQEAGIWDAGSASASSTAE